MAFLIVGTQPAGSVFGNVIVDYTGTGGEGTDFTVPINATMADDDYAVTWSSAGGSSGDGTQTSGVEVVDIPIASRTTTAFRVVLGSALAAGDELQFVVTGNLAL